VESPRRAGTEAALAGTAFFLSGAAGLVYQVSWQRILALHSGVGIYSIAIIVAAFMAGLGLGSWLGGRWSARLDARRSLQAFGLVEVAIAACGLVSCAVYYDWLYLRGSWLYGTTLRAAVLHALALLPPTALMGMSLPFLVRAMVRRASAAGRTIGLLYAVNLLGASAGALLTPWVLIRALGVRGAVTAAAAANAFAGFTALALALRRRAEPAAEAAVPEATTGAEPAGRHPFALWVALYALSGFCALALEIVWFRLLEVSVKATAFTFGTMLALYLLGVGLGCACGAFVAPRLARPLRAFLILQCLLLAYAGAAVALLATLPPDTPGYRWLVWYWGQGAAFKLGLHQDTPTLLTLYAVLPGLVFGPPTVLMGLSFPALQRAVQDDVRTSGRKVGFLQAANIAGCTAGSLAVGLLLLQWLGTAGALTTIVLLGLLFAIVGARLYGTRSVFPVLAALLAAVTLWLPGQRALWLRLHGTDDARSLVQEDATSVCAILPQTNRWAVFVNGRTHSWLPFGGVHTQIGAAASVVHPAPRDIAIIGLGSGDTAWAAGCRPETRALTVFEIAGPQPVLLSRLDRAHEVPRLASFLRDPRLAVRVADGRNALTLSGEQYDIVEADALWPEAGYAGNLYSIEFFEAVARRLKPGGLMCTWSPTHRVYASFTTAFPYVLGNEQRDVLIGSNEPIAVDVAGWRARLHSPEVMAYLGEANAVNAMTLLEQLRPLNLKRRPRRQREVNRDLFPRDEFLSPGG
jgi:predicted membrane-bound spermidine synthase